ncbi:hypothetical protein CK203_115369 [Vitis vinifera]|uniref:Uncharacterized protein n=1 Tax=Vitis vinifera TaxID=29760 RepID=A0A438D1R9_VITVI|nr:hypothetical protein CK203_115369 [Vitis vinifera]
MTLKKWKGSKALWLENLKLRISDLKETDMLDCKPVDSPMDRAH